MKPNGEYDHRKYQRKTGHRTACPMHMWVYGRSMRAVLRAFASAPWAGRFSHDEWIIIGALGGSPP